VSDDTAQAAGDGMNEERLAEIEQRADTPCRCDDEQCVSELRQVLDGDVPAMAAEIRQLRARLAEIGETEAEWGVRTYDNDDEIEVMSSLEEARDLADAWRLEIPGSNPTVRVRTRQGKPGEWREVPDA